MPPKVASATSLGSAHRRLGNEGKQGAICSCLTFLLADEVCALFQSWNSCLNVTSVSIFIQDDKCLWFLFPHGFIQRHRLVLFTSKNIFALVCFVARSMGALSCLTYALNSYIHMIQTHQRRVGSWKSLQVTGPR